MVRHSGLKAAQLGLVAEQFRILGEPARLAILNALRTHERTVSELQATTGLGQANLSKHLRMLLDNGFVARRKEGTFAWYRLADTGVFDLCDIMCGRLAGQAAEARKLFG